jgi:hypothetical protein
VNERSGLRIGVLISGGCLARWQADALRAIAAGNRFTIYNCTNSAPRRQPLKHGLYYGLNLLAVRNRLTASVAIPAELHVDDDVDFEAKIEGGWEALPEELLERIAADGPDVIIKFGMGLLRVANGLPPILSFHHGDPRKFRGRPAGFYEILSGASTIGQIVQLLSNKLDAGEVVAFAETKAHPHSWRQSLVEAYRVSPLLLPCAIDNALSGKTVPIERGGRNYRLPSNLTALRFAARSATAALRRLAYGGFIEKRWQVAEAELPNGWGIDDLRLLLDMRIWRRIEVPRRYRFLADPFFASNGDVLAEAMRRDGRGEIVTIVKNSMTTLPIATAHCSYPAPVEFDGKQFLLPEVSDWSSPLLYPLTKDGVAKPIELDIPGRPRLFDATLARRTGAWFLFGNRAEEGDRVLRLWVADSPIGPFAEHPGSPVCISPAGGRMGGLVFERGKQLYRAGQDLRRGYGRGLILFEIEELSPTAYRESERVELSFRNHRGPHTLNIRGNRALFDYYDDHLSLLAGVRRLRQSRAG